MPVLPEARSEELTPIGSDVSDWRPGAYSFVVPSHLDHRRDLRRLRASLVHPKLPLTGDVRPSAQV
jgi:hypothetical protein